MCGEAREEGVEDLREDWRCVGAREGVVFQEKQGDEGKVAPLSWLLASSLLFFPSYLGRHEREDVQGWKGDWGRLTNRPHCKYPATLSSTRNVAEPT